MTAVLGLDAAWTAGGTSGAALAAKVDGRWQYLAVAPGYGLFCDLAHGRIVEGGQWTAKPGGGGADAPALLQAAKVLLARAGCAGDVRAVAVDMPLAPTALPGRRAADNLAAGALARYGCGVHSPVPERPGLLGAALTAAFAARGYPLAVADGARPEPGLYEVYPHAELIALQMEAGGVARADVRRCAYKASRSTRYWPDVPKDGRIAFLLHNFEVIRDMLGQVLGLPAIPLPAAEGMTLAGLKPFEDGLDALACCAAGIRCLEGRARPLGDANGAIWIPKGI
jgi:predicted RNase H-like nuclease